MAARAGGTTSRTGLTAARAENRGEELNYTAVKARAGRTCGAPACTCRHIQEGTIIHPYHSE
ncbi:hypothetical protein CsSME_00019879 [Camellia sinensis var. sinensis]